MPFPKGKKNPAVKGNGWKRGASGNPKGRPPKGQSFAEHCRSVAGDGLKLAWLYGCLAGVLPVDLAAKSFGSSGVEFATRVKDFLKGATTRDRLWCAGRLEDRAFGLVSQPLEHSGEIQLPVRVVHEYST